MRSINRCHQIDAIFDELDAAQSRLLASSFDSLTGPELLAVLGRYALLMGRLDALRYELTSPFARPSRAQIGVSGRA
jgi:hypothetical protein